jgi:hypothetical protein
MGEPPGVRMQAQLPHGNAPEGRAERENREATAPAQAFNQFEHEMNADNGQQEAGTGLSRQQGAD